LLFPCFGGWGLGVSHIWFTYCGIPDFLATEHQICTVQNGQFASLFWFLVPPGCDRVPYGVLQPSILTRVSWAGGPYTTFDIEINPVVVSAAIWQYTREDLIMSGGLHQGGVWFTPGERTEKELIARE